MPVIRKLTREDWDIVDRFCLENSSYFIVQSGDNAETRAAEDLFQSLPAGKSLDDKFIFGYFLGDRLAGIAEGIRDYPQEGSWVIGFFIIAEELRKQSLGKDFLQGLEGRLRDSGALCLRIGVLDVNQGGMVFWEKSGYIRTGEVKEMTFDERVHRVHVLTKE